MQFAVDKSDLHRLRFLPSPGDPLAAGQARIGIDSFGLTANNITYGVHGNDLNYWGCFPLPEADGVAWGRIPVWGFGQVVESNSPDATVGTRLYGYFPPGDELVIEPGRCDEQGFSDVMPARESVPSVYSRYSFTSADPIYDPGREDQQMLLWPLFVTSFVIDDFLGDNDLYGASTVVISSASAKTSIGAAFLLAGRQDVQVVGLTSEGNRDFVGDLGCYHEVLTYDDLARLDAPSACYIDVAGRRDVTHAVHAALNDRLRYSMVVGDTHWDVTDAPSGALAGPRPEFLFAPTQIAKRRTDWGRDGFEQRVGEAWGRFSPWTDGWMTIRHCNGPEAVETAYRNLLDGRVDPRTADVCSLTDS